MFTPKEKDLLSEAARVPSVASWLTRCQAKAQAARVRLSYVEKEAD